MKYDGVSQLKLSKKHNLVYTAGKEGSLFIHKYADFDESKLQKDAEYNQSFYANIQEQIDEEDEMIPHYSKVLEAEDDALKEQERQSVRQKLKNRLLKISSKLTKLLE